jgi:cell division protein FtsW (lipid II flippase)
MKPQPAPNTAQTDFTTLALFAVASLGAVAFGSIGLALGGAGPGIWLRNPAAWVVGLGMAGLILIAGRSAWFATGAILLAPIALVATFFSAPQSGVHRWVDAGPLHINMASLVLPVTVVALAALTRTAPLFLGVAGVIGLILVIQPDASQATAFLLACGLILLRSSMSKGTKIAGSLGAAVLVAASWLRPDPLDPVPEVEGIFLLLAGISPALAALAALALAVCALVPLRRARVFGGDAATGSMALALYFAASAVMPAAGAFPVPLVGVGMSFPVGYWMAVALLCARASRPADR